MNSKLLQATVTFRFLAMSHCSDCAGFTDRDVLEV